MPPIRKTKSKPISSMNENNYSLSENNKRKMYLCKNEMPSVKSGSGDIIEPIQQPYQAMSKEFEPLYQGRDKQRLDNTTGIGKSSKDIVMRSFSSQNANR